MILESPFSAPLRLAIPRSPSVLCMIVIPLLFISLVVLYFTALHWSILLLVVLVIAATGYYFLRLHYWQNLQISIREINQDARGQWSVLSNAGDDAWHNAVLLPTSFVSTFLIVLNFKVETHRCSVILPADSLDSDTFRRLRVRIKVAFS